MLKYAPFISILKFGCQGTLWVYGTLQLGILLPRWNRKIHILAWSCSDILYGEEGIFVFFLQDATGVCQLPECLVRLADPGSMKIQLSWFGSLESFLCPWRNMEDSHSSFVITEILALLQSLCPVPPQPALRPSVHCCLVEAAVDWGTLPWFCRSQTWFHCLLVVPEKNDRSWTVLGKTLAFSLLL